MEYEVTQGEKDGVWVVVNHVGDVIFECHSEYDARMRAEEMNDLVRANKEKEEAKPPTCLNCRYWDRWDHSWCATRAVALDDFSPVHPDTPACSEFQPE